jgi:predicted DsbA family dithiol-disulfide isomerase
MTEAPPPTIQVYSDYVCPFCFLAEGPLQQALAAMEDRIAVRWMPFELRPHPTPTLEPEGDYLQSTWQSSVYPLAAKLGIEIVLPKVSPQPYTRLAFEGALYAEGKGKAAAYNHRMFTAFFQDELDIGAPDVLTACAEEIGLDGVEFRQALEEGHYREPCGALLDYGRQTLGISSVPSFLVGRTLVPGLVPKETLIELFTQYLAQPSAEGVPEPPA